MLYYGVGLAALLYFMGYVTASKLVASIIFCLIAIPTVFILLLILIDKVSGRKSK